jgi:hypothetical protein
MATITIENDYGGRIIKSVSAGSVNWLTDVRNATTGSSVNNYTTNTSIGEAIRVQYTASRGGSSGACNRFFLFFDTSTVDGTITACDLKVLGYLNSGANVIPVESTAYGGNGSSTTLGLSDYDNLDFSTAYASATSSWTTTGYNTFSLNATAISAMNTNSYLNVALIDEEYDYSGSSPTTGTNYSSGIEIFDTTSPIVLDITYTPSGYGNSVIGVSSSNIGKVFSVDSSNINKVIGV